MARVLGYDKDHNERRPAARRNHVGLLFNSLCSQIMRFRTLETMLRFMQLEVAFQHPGWAMIPLLTWTPTQAPREPRIHRPGRWHMKHATTRDMHMSRRARNGATDAKATQNRTSVWDLDVFHAGSTALIIMLTPGSLGL